MKKLSKNWKIIIVISKPKIERDFFVSEKGSNFLNPLKLMVKNSKDIVVSILQITIIPDNANQLYS